MRSLLWKLTGCVLFVLCAAWYGRIHFYRDPGSVWFDKTRAYERHYSRSREDEVKEFIESYAPIEPSNSPGKSSINASICIGVSSVKRDHEQYLEVRTHWHATISHLPHPEF